MRQFVLAVILAAVTMLVLAVSAGAGGMPLCC